MTKQDKIHIKETVNVLDKILNESFKIVENTLKLSKTRQLSNQVSDDLNKILESNQKMLVVKTYLNSLINQ